MKKLPLHEMAEHLLTARQNSDMGIITKMYRQQKDHFDRNDSRESEKDRERQGGEDSNALNKGN